MPEYYVAIAICVFVGLLIGVFGYALWNREIFFIDDWIGSTAFAFFGAVVWPLTFAVAGFGIALTLLARILQWLNRVSVRLLNDEKPEPTARDSETPYR
jgi:TRAP-type C4-dicarboxylate transport system permease small subunit